MQNSSHLVIGIPRERVNCEFRVASTPETVKKLISQGHKVLIETDAGLGASVPNEAYAAVGAEIVNAVQS